MSGCTVRPVGARTESDYMADTTDGNVWVPVVEVRSGREIGWGANAAELLKARLSDIRAAVAAGADSVAGSLNALPAPDQWKATEVSACFGITLTAEAGVILSKASTEATFEITITFSRQLPDQLQEGHRAGPGPDRRA